MTAPLRVLIADDHVPTRAGVRLALEGRGFAVCADVGDAEAAVAAARSERPDVCLLDVHMPGGGGLKAAAQIAAELPETSIVMLTISRNDSDLFAAIESGAVGYLLKDMDPVELPDSLRAAIAGEAPLPPRLVARLVDEFRERATHRQFSLVRRSPDDLTSREWEVLDCLGGGLATAEVAKKLYISETTVRRHIGAVVRKLGASSREDAIRIARERSAGRSARSGNLNAE